MSGARTWGQANEAMDDEVTEVERFEVPESAFDSWVFRHGESNTTIEARLHDALSLVKRVH